MRKPTFSFAVKTLDLSDTRFIIIAIGALKLIGGKLPYFLGVGEETAIERVVRQIKERGGEPTICTNRLPVLEGGYGNTVHAQIRSEREGLKLMATNPYWDKSRTVILYADAVYSKETMDRIVLIDTEMAMFGDYEQIIAYSFSSKQYKKFSRAINKWSGYLYGDTNYIYRYLAGLEIMENVYESYGETMTIYRPLDDYSCRFNTINDYTSFIKRGELDD